MEKWRKYRGDGGDKEKNGVRERKYVREGSKYRDKRRRGSMRGGGMGKQTPQTHTPHHIFSLPIIRTYTHPHPFPMLP
jgi:hypothetical protein